MRPDGVKILTMGFECYVLTVDYSYSSAQHIRALRLNSSRVRDVCASALPAE